MFEFFQEFILPLFFKTEEKNKLVNKVTLYVIKEISSFIEDEDGKIKKQISKLESPKITIYEGKVTIDPHKIREIMSDPINYPKNNPEAMEKAITFEQRDMISSIYDMISTTLEGFNSSSKILMNSIKIFFGKNF